MRLRPKFWQFSDLKPRAFCASTIAITAFCWIGAVERILKITLGNIAVFMQGKIVNRLA